MIPTLTLVAALTACIDEPARYVYGQDLDSLEFVLFSRDVGVYPDISVLADPNNPFVVGMDAETKWDLTGDAAWVPAFYAWATVLAREPGGEQQYYTALMLGEIYNRQLADDDDLYFVWANAVAGHQTVLDDFPDSVTYDATGTIAYRLAPLSYQAIIALGGEPEGDWIEVPTEDGGTTIVPGS